MLIGWQAFLAIFANQHHCEVERKWKMLLAWHSQCAKETRKEAAFRFVQRTRSQTKKNLRFSVGGNQRARIGREPHNGVVALLFSLRLSIFISS